MNAWVFFLGIQGRHLHSGYHLFSDIAIQFDLRQTYKGGRISGEGKQSDMRYPGFRNWPEASCEELIRYIGEMHTTTEKQKSLFDRNIHARVLSLVVCVSYFSMEVIWHQSTAPLSCSRCRHGQSQRKRLPRVDDIARTVNAQCPA